MYEDIHLNLIMYQLQKNVLAFVLSACNDCQISKTKYIESIICERWEYLEELYITTKMYY